MHMPDPEAVCLNCLAEKPRDGDCPRCGYAEHRHSHHPLYLKPHSVLQDQYVTGKALGQGGFGITYLCLDTHLRKPVAIKEYLPATLATRDVLQGVVVPLAHQEEAFQKGLKLFLDEARNLARFDHPNIVRVLNYFEAHQTGYMVMEYLEGDSPLQVLKRHGGRLSLDAALDLLLPILDALHEVHAQQVYHLDVSAQNVRLDQKGRPILIDFGAARQIIGDYTHSLALVLRPGYSPLEQYYADGGKVGPWTDVYASGALFYVLLTGRLPTAAPERMDEDRLRMPGAWGVQVPAGIETALRRALAIRVEDRYASVAEFKQALLAGRNTADAPPPAPPRRRAAVYLLGGGLLLAAGAAAWHLERRPPPPAPPPADRPAAPRDAPQALLPAQASAPEPPEPRPAPIQVDPQEQEIGRLLRQAEAQFAALRLSTPAGDNAFETYRRVLALRPGQPQALAGLDQLAERYAALARAASDPAQRQAHLAKGLSVRPEHPALLALQAAPMPPPAAPAPAPPSTALREEADNQLARGQLEAAHAAYKQLLADEPEAARAGLEKLAGRYLQLAQAQRQAGDIPACLVTIGKGLAVLPGHADLLALQQELGRHLAPPPEAAMPAPPPAPPSAPAEPGAPGLLTPTF